MRVYEIISNAQWTSTDPFIHWLSLIFTRRGLVRQPPGFYAPAAVLDEPANTTEMHGRPPLVQKHPSDASYESDREESMCDYPRS